MPSKWFKTNSKIPHLKLSRFFQTISDKIMGKFCYLHNFFHSTPPPLAHPPLTLTILRVNERILRQAVMASQHCKWGKGGFLNSLFRIPIFSHWLYYYYYYYYYYCYYYYLLHKVGKLFRWRRHVIHMLSV